MGRKRAEGIPQAPRQVEGYDKRAGGVRIAWAYLAALAAAAVTGLGFSIADVISAGLCATDNTSCSLGIVVLGGSISAALGALIAGLAMGLGWEWVIVQIAAVAALPALLDAWGPAAWAVLAFAPLVGALLTWSGRNRPWWRPVQVGVLGGSAIAAALLWTYVVG